MKNNLYIKKFASLTTYNDPDRYKRWGMYSGMGVGALGGGLMGGIIGSGPDGSSIPGAAGGSLLGALGGAALLGMLGYGLGKPVDGFRKITGINLKKIPTIDDVQNTIRLDPKKSVAIDPKSVPQLLEALKSEGYI